jgi:hypothetical protein
MIDVRDDRDVANVVTPVDRSFSHLSVIRERWNIVKAPVCPVLLSGHAQGET